MKSGRVENLSLLPALTIDGYMAIAVYRGGVNAEQYEDFVKTQVLPKCSCCPGPRSILIIGNCKIHHETVYFSAKLFSNYQETTNVQEIIERAGCKCEFLPPYSPDFNPIEYPFFVIKKHFKHDGGITGD